jgi:hypothetical protein
MYKSLKGVASLALLGASLYAGNAAAALTVPSSISIPVPGLATLTLGSQGLGLNLLSGLANVSVGGSSLVGLNLFGGAKSTPIIGVALFGKNLVDVHVGQVAAVPEPETFAMMGLGLGMIGFAARRRKSQQQ